MGIGSGTNFSQTPAMFLRLPTPGVCGPLGVEPPGLSWLELVNASLGTVDGHTHAPGFGIPVPAAGLNINGDLPFGSNNATALRSVRFSPIGLASLAASDLSCLVVSGGDLYFVDAQANQVRLTAAGGVAGTPGSISGLASPAAVTYTPVSKLFSFASSSGVAAGISAGPLSIGDASVAGGKSITITAPAGLAGNYGLTLPGALPGSDGLMRLSTTGALSAFSTIAANVPTFPAGLTLNGGLSLASGFTGIQTTGAATFLVLQGNLAAAGAGADVILNSTATRSANLLAQVQNNGVGKLNVDFQGLLALASQAGPIQPASIVTAITPVAGWTAGAGLAYWKDATGVVRFKGTITLTSGSQPFFTLPAGFRPAVDRFFPMPDTSTTGTVVFLDVGATGTLSFFGITPTVGHAYSLDGISFLAEQ